MKTARSLPFLYFLTEDSNKDDEDLTLDCPKNQLIEGDSKSSSPTTPLPTGMPGATGMTGPKVGAVA